MKNQKLSNEEIIEICEVIITELQETPFPYLCAIFADILRRKLKIFISSEAKEIQQYIPEFTRENALKFGANTSICRKAWWNYINITDRIAFVNWIKSQYE